MGREVFFSFLLDLVDWNYKTLLEGGCQLAGFLCVDPMKLNSCSFCLSSS